MKRSRRSSFSASRDYGTIKKRSWWKKDRWFCSLWITWLWRQQRRMREKKKRKWECWISKKETNTRGRTQGWAKETRLNQEVDSLEKPRIPPIIATNAAKFHSPSSRNQKKIISSRKEILLSPNQPKKLFFPAVTNWGWFGNWRRNSKLLTTAWLMKSLMKVMKKTKRIKVG